MRLLLCHFSLFQICLVENKLLELNRVGGVCRRCQECVSVKHVLPLHSVRASPSVRVRCQTCPPLGVWPRVSQTLFASHAVTPTACFKRKSSIIQTLTMSLTAFHWDFKIWTFPLCSSAYSVCPCSLFNYERNNSELFLH